MQYNKKKWLDHIVDEVTGQVVQQGTALSAGNFNNMEAGLANAAVLLANSAAAIREAIPSGLTKLSAIDFTYGATNPNKMKLTGGGTAFVNGFKVDIPDGTIIDLGLPPTAGERDDLVFLEVWRDVAGDTTGETINSRIRVVQGVDFTILARDGVATANGLGYETTDITKVWFTPQGGNDTPVAYVSASTADRLRRSFRIASYASYKVSDDAGLFVAGYLGDQASKDALKTADGYVYAIPLFRVRRRNSGGYSVVNPNGARTWAKINSTVTKTIAAGYTDTITVTDTAPFSPGDTLSRNGVPNCFFVLSVDSATQLTVRNILTITVGVDSSSTLEVATYNRPDKLFNNIIDERDIIDLRHKVSLTGFNYQTLLEENFDKLLRGELQTKERKKMIKTYHGIKKTPVDANMVFYLSGESTTAEVGSVVTATANKFKAMPSGSGLKFENGQKVTSEAIGVLTEATIDVTISSDEFFIPSSYYQYIVALSDANGYPKLGISKATDGKSVNFHLNAPEGSAAAYNIENFKNHRFLHFRLTYKDSIGTLLVNGKVIAALNRPTSLSNTTLNISSSSTNYNYTGSIADISVSNIDRGTNFATLPQDVIDGYARVMPAMNGQRKTHSDALTGQYTVGIAKGIGSAHSKGITKTQATPGTWASGDTIKVKGLAGEIISGVIDTDTALARTIGVISGANTTTQVILVDDATKFAVNDICTFVGSDGMVSSRIWTVTAIDSATKYVTFTLNLATDIGSGVGGFFVETTASTSVPIAKFMNSGTLTAVTGTWSGLGTNEATFTLGTNASLVNADVQIEYSLNMPSGQGGVPEVYTTTLAGEAKGKKLAVGTIAVTDDFVGKVVGSTTVNPNLAKYREASTTLLEPSNGNWAELTQPKYDAVKVLGGNTMTATTSVNGAIPQQLFSFDLIRIVEDKYGPIPSVDKVAWLKANVDRLNCIWYGYGSGPNGNKASFVPYNVIGSAWQAPAPWSSDNTANVPTKESISLNASNGTTEYKPTANIDTNGISHFMAYTDASNGTTASTIFTDYVNIEVTLKTPTGYDVLVPENPRRDDGLANVLLVRKETKEVQTFFDAVNTDGLVTYGDFVPYQGLTAANVYGKALTEPVGFYTSDGTGGPRNTTVYAGTHPVPMVTQLPTNVNDHELAGADLASSYATAGTKCITRDVILIPYRATANGYFFPSTGRVVGITNLAGIAKRGVSSTTTNGRYTLSVARAGNMPVGVTEIVGGIIVAVSLMEVNGELHLLIGTTRNLFLSTDGSAKIALDAFKVDGRPLVKGV